MADTFDATLKAEKEVASFDGLAVDRRYLVVVPIHELDVTFTDGAGEPYARLPYVVTFRRRPTVRGQLDERGRFLLQGVPSGQYEVTFDAAGSAFLVSEVEGGG